MTRTTTTDTPPPSTLSAKVGTGDLKNQVSALSGYQRILTAFVDSVMAVGTLPSLSGNNADPTALATANAALSTLNGHFGAAQTTVKGLEAQIDGITKVVTAAQTFAHHGSITMATILKAVTAYTASTLSNDDKKQLAADLGQMSTNCQVFADSFKDAGTSTQTARNALLKVESTLDTDLNALQACITPVNGKLLDLTTLSEKQAFDQLQTTVNDLNTQASQLKSEITGLTVGLGLVGGIGGVGAGFVFVTNFWNPIGWAAVGGVVAGEVVMAGQKSADVSKLNSDMMNIALSQNEQAILHPIYAIKNMLGQLDDGVTAMTGIHGVLTTLQSQFTTAQADVDKFLGDVTANVAVGSLQADALYVQADYDDLYAACKSLLSPIPVQSVDQQQMTKVQDAPA